MLKTSSHNSPVVKYLFAQEPSIAYCLLSRIKWTPGVNCFDLLKTVWLPRCVRFAIDTGFAVERMTPTLSIFSTKQLCRDPNSENEQNCSRSSENYFENNNHN